MDKIAKFLRRLSVGERDPIENVLVQIRGGKMSGLDIQKLHGHRDIFRVRVKSIRVIYQHTKDGIVVLDVSRRNEKTYRDF